ncbi:transposase family protein [Rhodopseudomonas palustris]|uniref:transposase family protein n=1 Tax=Rhodopseudomonas palustris TaxID=1076 RepID=UPI002ACEC160|nr:transposase family protein [Rhodopseudomonas palustris]WQH00881.1 transposase family protein [Rhodopseudomonas palustris]
MNLGHVPVQLRTGATIRLDTRRYIVGPPGDQVRVFTDKESGTEKALANTAILHMMRSGRITTDAAFRALPPVVQDNLQVDWGAFSDVERLSAERKYPFVKAIDDLPAPFRDRRKHVLPAIERVIAEATDDLRPPREVTFRRAREWYLRWLVAGRDIRALVDTHRKKGNRTPRLAEWHKQEIMNGIDEVYRNEIAGSKADAREAAARHILLRADRDGLALPSLGAKEVIGKHLVSRMINKMEVYDLTVARHGKRQADFLMKAVRKGPACSMPLEEAEVDHTRLDLIVVDKNGLVLGRPWLTVIIDRWSRMILGLSLSFTPPSWVSVMEALRVAVQPKDGLLAKISSAAGRDVTFRFPWPCYGPMTRLFCDNGAEFRSRSMRQTERALNMQIVDLPRAAGWLKGRVERWFRSHNQGVIHKLPGTTKSNPRDRGTYNSEKHAVLTLEDANWIIAKWIVDVYHTTIHSEIGETPLDRWTRGILEVGERPAPPEELLVPLTGLVIDRHLRSPGIEFEGLRWNSNAFSGLRNRLAGNSAVTVRIDPQDLRTAYILDPTALDAKAKWVEGYLQADEEVAKLTLYQYRVLKKARQNSDDECFDPKKALARAKSSQEIIDLIDERSPRKKLPKKAVRFLTDGRNPSEHLRGEHLSPDESERKLDSYDPDRTLMSSPPDERGPYRDRTPAVETPPSRAILDSPEVDLAAFSASADAELEPKRVVTPDQSPQILVVKRRSLD